MAIYLNLHLRNMTLKVVNIHHMQRHLAAANSVGQSCVTALLLSVSRSHFEIGRSKQFLSTQTSLGATSIKLGKVADRVLPILSNFLCGTMWQLGL